MDNMLQWTNLSIEDCLRLGPDYLEDVVLTVETPQRLPGFGAIMMLDFCDEGHNHLLSIT